MSTVAPPQPPAAAGPSVSHDEDLSPTRGARKALRSVLFWLGLGVSCVLAYFALRGLDLAAVPDSLAAGDWIWLAPALAALALAILFKALRWRALFAPEARPSVGVISGALMIGYLFNNILPVRAGEVIRAVALNQRAGVSRTQALATVALERSLDVVCLVALLLIALPWLPPLAWVATAAILGAILVAALLAAFVLVGPSGRKAQAFAARVLGMFPLISPETATRVVEGAVQGLAALRNPRLALPALAWTTASWIMVALSAWLLMQSFELDLSPVSGLLVVIAINLALVLPSAPAALGVWEAATLVALKAYGVESEIGLAYALAYHALNLVPFLVGGAIALHFHRTALRRARAAAAMTSA